MNPQDKLLQEIGKKVLNILVILALIISVLGFIVDFSNTLNYGAVDLRNRVVGARLLLEGKDPYYFKWQPGMPDTLLDPLDDPKRMVSRVTVPPTVLMVQAPLARLNYLTQKIIWFLLQWGLFIGTVIIFYKLATSPIKRNLLLIISLLFFSGSYFWRFHVERGQIYILYVFLLSCAYWLAQKPFKTFKYNHILSGFLVGLTASFRPPVVLMFIPMFLYNQWQLLIGSIVGILSGLFISFAFAGTFIWKNYLSAIKGYAEPSSGNSLGNSSNVNITYPEQIEGMNNVAKYINFTSRDTSFINFFQLKLGLNIDPRIFLILLIVVLLVISLFIYKNRRDVNTINLVFISGVFIYLISEYFIPTPRSTYNNVQWIMPVALIILSYKELDFLSNKLNILLLVSLFFNIGFTWMSMGIRTSDMMMILYTILMFLGLVKRRNKSREKLTLEESR
jgi:hypothetical protein